MSLPRPFSLLPALCLALASVIARGGTDVSPSPDLSEFATQIRKLWPDAPTPAPGQTNTEAYLRGLAPRVLPGRDTTPASPSTNGVLLSRSLAYASGSTAYFRIDEVAPGLRDRLEAAYAALAKTTTVKGVVVDLRFARGQDYAAAAAAAGLFARRPVQDLRLGDQSFPVTPTEGRPAVPVMVLVNRATRGAAEALAAAVRAAASPALLLGNPTSGEARLYQNATLENGTPLRIATTPLILPSGQPLPESGLAPDLLVTVSEPEERHYQTNEFVRFVAGRPVNLGTLALSARLNEAELVRRRTGRRPDNTPDSTESPHGTRRGSRLRPEPDTLAESAPPIADPVLARALDLVSGLTSPPEPEEGDSR